MSGAQILVPVAEFARTVAGLVRTGWTQPDWLTQTAAYQLSWPVTAASVRFLAQDGKIALTTASRASDLSSSYGSLQTTIGTVSVAINDDVTASSGRHVTVYAGYDEAQAQPGCQGLSFGREIDAANLTGLPPPVPSPGAPLSWGAAGAVAGTVGGLWIAAGGEHSGAKDASFALGIKDNGARFEAGLVFGAQALTDHGGFGFAARLARGHLLQWHDAADAPGPNIGSTVADAANAVSLQFQDGGATFVGANGAALASVQAVPRAVNGLALTPGVSGAPVALTAFGADASVGLDLVVKGGAFRVLGAAKPQVSGTRNGNAALASLISALAGLGLISDQTTA